jgi:hypothetical protein
MLKPWYVELDLQIDHPTREDMASVVIVVECLDCRHVYGQLEVVRIDAARCMPMFRRSVVRLPDEICDQIDAKHAGHLVRAFAARVAGPAPKPEPEKES